MTTNIRFISAGAGSGKTYRLTQELEDALTKGRARPACVIGTTFTKKAARELRERVRQRLVKNGWSDMANALEQALLGTVNSICDRLLRRFAFETGLSPDLEVLPEEEAQLHFNTALESAITNRQIRLMNQLGARLGISEWPNVVKNIADAARANNMKPKHLRQFGTRNAAELLKFFPKPTSRDLDRLLEGAIGSAVADIEASDDTTKKTAAYLRLLKTVQSDIGQQRLDWSGWVKLSKDLPAKKCILFAEPVQEIALDFESHPRLHDDIRAWCKTVFEAAAAVMTGYQEIKARRGIVDFVDQEQMMLEALELPDVSVAFEDELDLLLVDEFQDTSPIQLALFLKLANLAKHTVFVGDIKQAIYAFRGSDPELMQAVLRSVQQKGGKTDILKSSWRSRPSLVHYTNSVFTPVFSHLMSAEKVELTPVRSEIKGETAVEHWALKGSNKEKRAAALAHGISRLIDRGPLVHDRKLDQQRPVRFDDIAILTRTNPNVEIFAQALAAEGIPVKRTRTGLAATPEVCLALACLRRLLDSYDTLASAEIVALNDGCPHESWLEDRLRYLAEGHPGNLWGEVVAYTHPVLSVLAENRQEATGLSPSEAVALSIQVADIRRTVQSWGPNRQRARQRVQNLDALIWLAEDYEERSETQHRTATANGFLLWIKDLAAAKLDNQPEDPEAEAVQVLTHHAAKGLEWPVVVSTGLEDRVWSRLWNVGVVTDRSEIDLRNPLADRFIRYWPWPFGGHSKGIPMVDRVNASQMAQTCKALDIAEHQRLLYVSMTRARDLMILALPENKTSGEWMETLNTPWMIPTGDTLTLPDGKAIRTAARVLDETAEAVSSEIRDSESFWFGPRATLHEKLPLLIRPHAEAPAENAVAKLVKKTGAGIGVVRSPDMEALGQVMHSVIAAETVNPSSEDALEVTKRIIETFGLNVYLEPQGVLEVVRAFLKFVQREFSPRRLWAEYPITHVLDNGQIVKGWIDLLIETDSNWVIIDHKSSIQNEDRLKETSLKYSGQLFCYKNAVEAASGKTADCWIHYPVSGYMVRLEQSG